MTTMLSTENTPNELRCPNPHPEDVARGACNRLLAKYGGPFTGTVSIQCPRCKAPTTFLICSTG
ncbi:MAG: hypothetical protein ACEQSX_08200 [Baekduiaceae bacterium]